MTAVEQKDQQKNYQISRRSFLKLGALVGGVTLASVASSYIGRKSDLVGMLAPERVNTEDRNDKLWGEYNVGTVDLGEVQGLRIAEGHEDLIDSINKKCKVMQIENPQISVVEVVGDKNNALIPLIWTTKDDKVDARWSIWTFNKEKEIIPPKSEKDENLAFIEMSKVVVQSSFIIGPTKDIAVERFISFVQNWGWEMYLPYKGLDKLQGPIPLNDTTKDLQEFLVK